MQLALYAIGFAILGYLLGSLTPSIWITRFLKGVDVRDAGSGHATTTNTIRQAGFGPGLVVFILDFAKGFIPTWLAIKYAPAEWIVILTAASAIIGHCWPVFAQFRGGMGLATAGGGMLAVNPFATLIAFGVLIGFVLIIRHSARASVIGGILLAPIMYLLKQPAQVIWLSVAIGLVISVRFLIDWNRKYRELWLDREKK